MDLIDIVIVYVALSFVLAGAWALVQVSYRARILGRRIRNEWHGFVNRIAEDIR